MRKRIAQEATAGACLSGSNGSSRRVKARTDREDGGGLAGDVSTLDRGGAANLTRREGDPSGGDAGIGVMFHGCTVAIYCAAHRRLLRVDALGSMRAARLVEGPELPREWEWERFVVVDGGGGMVALFCCLNGHPLAHQPHTASSIPASITLSRIHNCVIERRTTTARCAKWQVVVNPTAPELLLGQYSTAYR